MRWFFPSTAGDHRLVSDPENPSGCRLIVEKASEVEQKLLAKFARGVVKKDWLHPSSEISADEHFFATDRTVHLRVPLKDAGKALLKIIRPARATLTAVKYSNGTVSVTESQEAALDEVLCETSTAAEPAKAPAAAVSVSRPTLCCPRCVPGSVERASEVLQEFLTPEQHEDWARCRQIVVHGHLSGHRYILSHRHSAPAVRQGFICHDVDSRTVLHFHDWSVPPEEEVLAAKLLLEHREPWLRNEASLWHVYESARCEPLFKNPFGNFLDGTRDAAFLQGMGQVLYLLGKAGEHV